MRKATIFILCILSLNAAIPLSVGQYAVQSNPLKPEGISVPICNMFGCDCVPPSGARCCVGYRYDPRSQKCRKRKIMGSAIIFIICILPLTTVQYLRLLGYPPLSKAIPKFRELVALVYLYVTYLVVTAYHHRMQDAALVTDMIQEVKNAERLLDSCKKEKVEGLN